MEETICLVLHGCKLARDLESNLPDLGYQPNILLKSCEEIRWVFSKAVERLDAHRHNQMFTDDQMQEGMQAAETTSGGIQAINMLHAQQVGVDYDEHEGKVGLADVNVEAQPHPMAASTTDSARPSSSHGLRRRNDDTEGRRTIRVAAAQMGNTDIPPEDNFTWRKYGQKEILGSKFPRSYYRCTHQKLYQCPAKKQVQRLDHDPYTFEVTYRGNHTCHMSTTAPAPAPPPPPPPPSPPPSVQMTAQTTTSQTAPPSPPIFPLGQWLSMDTSAFIDPHMHIYKGHLVLADHAGPSNTIRYGRDVGDQYQPVADLADAMFNSGSSSSTSMDLIFSSMEDKRKAAANKKN